MATGNFAKDSSSALGTEDVDNETQDGNENSANNGHDAVGDDNGASSSASKPKKARTSASDEDGGLIAAFTSGCDKLANAIVKAGASNSNDVPEDLFDNLNNLPGFEEAHVSFYYAYLVANPHIAKAFNKLPFNHKINWFAMFVSEKFPAP